MEKFTKYRAFLLFQSPQHIRHRRSYPVLRSHCTSLIFNLSQREQVQLSAQLHSHHGYPRRVSPLPYISCSFYIFPALLKVLCQRLVYMVFPGIKYRASCQWHTGKRFPGTWQRNPLLGAALDIHMHR